ncbi:MAG TPA: hypothetical protein VG269_00245 [Tepidisphaeraceae bacterium]|jgi:hypothetical protein|nr:hypothetical protein [Tepidisphaeraceae bacterium]
MTLPLTVAPHLELPSQLVIPLESLAAVSAGVTIALGFIYLFFGLRVFRVMTTIAGVIVGVVAGIPVGEVLDSRITGMVMFAILFGMAAWWFTRWTIALPIGLIAALAGWLAARACGANPLACFFISVASAVVVGAPVLVWYRGAVMILTSLHGASLVVAGTSTAILLVRRLPLNILETDGHRIGHACLAGVCVIVLAVPSFCFQQALYADLPIEAEDVDSDAGKMSGAKRKAV